MPLQGQVKTHHARIYYLRHKDHLSTEEAAELGQLLERQKETIKRRQRSDRARTYYLSHKEKLAADEAEELRRLLETRKETAKEINQRRQRRRRQMSKQSRVGRMRYLRNKDKLTADEAAELKQYLEATISEISGSRVYARDVELRRHLETLKAPLALSDISLPFQIFSCPFKNFLDIFKSLLPDVFRDSQSFSDIF